jgi:ABC-type branched-subunit amino acid transport system ATPase component
MALSEPERGRFEREELIGAGEGLMPIEEGPVPLSAAFARLRKGQSFYFLAVGVGVLGFALTSVPGLISLLLQDDYGYGAYTRGWMLAVSWALSLIAIPFAGARAEKLMRTNPPAVMTLCGSLLIAYGAAVVVALRFDAIAPLIACYAVANACQAAAFVLTAPIISSVVPPRLRSQAFALIGLYVFLMGGFFGNLLGGAMSDVWGQRTALTVIVPPAALIGAAFIIRAGRSVPADMALVAADLREENDEMRRAAVTSDAPAIQVRSLDCSYGRVQVLFGCELDVAPGETVALVGTNGSGKSTLLKAITGLMLPDRGVVRLHGRSMTYADAEYRFAQGVLLVRGGDGVFPGLSVRENLKVSLTTLKLSDAVEAERVGRVTELFPQLADRLDQRAGSLSGGERQMLALARALVHDPDVLIIDELSLGLAPVVVQTLIEVIDQLRARGQTMVIVEQSLNIALSIADRVVLLEKGHTRLVGTPDELRANGEVFDAMFLGGAAHVRESTA